MVYCKYFSYWLILAALAGWVLFYFDEKIIIMIVGMCSCSPEELIESPGTGVSSDCKGHSVDTGNQAGSYTRAVSTFNHWGIPSVPLCLRPSGC